MPVTLNYAIPYPDGTSQLVPLQSWFQNVAQGVDSALTTALSGSVGSGTSASRDVVFPPPATAADRVLLANNPARWYNTEKGWEEQFYARFDDAGVTAATPVRAVAGWAPAQHIGRVPISRFNVSGTNAQKQGSRVEMLSGCTEVILDDCFPDVFDVFEVEFVVLTQSAGGSPGFQLRKGGVTSTGTFYNTQVLQGSTSSVSATEGNGAASIVLGFSNLSQHSGKLSIQQAAQATVTLLQLDAASFTPGVNKGLGRRATVHTDTAPQTGLRIFPASGTFTGWVRVYGIL